MRVRLLASFFAVCLAAAAQTLTVDKLIQFIQSSEPMLKRGTMTDKDIAQYLTKAKMAERLDDRTLENIQSLGVGPKTLKELQRLRDESRGLGEAKPVEVGTKPAQAPPPSSEEQAAIIDDVRSYALAYSKRLPDFICTEVQRRYAARRPSVPVGAIAESEPDWQMQDTLTIRLSYFEQKEDYKLVLYNNKVTDQDYRTMGGTTVTGDFGSLLREIFDRSTQTHFEWDHWATIRKRLSMAFAYRVAQVNARWHVSAGPDHDIVPAYKGLVYIDAKSHEVVRITWEAVNLPEAFPIKSVQEVLDYDYTELSGQPFLLPLKAQTLIATDDRILTRNDTEFRLYRKYSAESILKFDTGDTPPPLPDDQTKETPTAPPQKNTPAPKK
jgi:hypothetical protein